jgi:alpha-galactosidase
VELLNKNSFNLNYVDFWGHSDADMLEVGNGGLSIAEERSHFAFWAAMKSPLLIGCDLAQISAESLNVLKNEYLLAFNQDPIFGAPAKPYKWGTNPNWTFNNSYPAEYWSGRFSNGTMVLVLNIQNSTAVKNINWGEVPELENGGTYRVIDAWGNNDNGCIQNGMDISLQAHDTGVFVLQEDC